MYQLVFLAGLISFISAECPGGFSDQRGFSDKPYASCYMFVDRATSWFDAATFCHTMGSHLVALETPEEHDYIVSLLPGKGLQQKHIWIGASDFQKEGSWMWLGSNAELGYSKWKPGQPSNYGTNEHFMELHSSYGYKWNDAPSTTGGTYAFVCEIPASFRECS